MDAVPAANFFNSTPSTGVPKRPQKIPVKSIKPVAYINVSDEEEVDQLMEDSVEPIPLKRVSRLWASKESWREQAFAQNPSSDDSILNIASSSKLIKSYSPPPARVETPEGGGWTTSKLLAMKDEGGGVEGIWLHGVLDYHYLPFPEVIPGLGSIVLDRGPRAAEQQDIAVEGAEPVELPTVRTITQEELDAARPHPDAFFSRVTYSWVIFTSILPNAALPVITSQLSPDRPHLWRIVPDSIPPEAVNLGPIFPPANPSLLSPKSGVDEADLEVKNFTRLSSSKSTQHFAYSLESGIPTVIPLNLWKAFEQARSEPLPGDNGKVAALAQSWSAVWR